LPISSTGHLRLAERFLFPTTPIPILFDVTLHIGTLIVTVGYFRKDIKETILKDRHTLLAIIIGSIPTGLIGLAFSDQIETTFQTVLPIAVALIICGTILYTSRTAREKTDTITYLAALIIGTAQGIAIIPGISRSGTTIATALLLGIKREKAFKFSFLLSIPAIIGALGWTFYRENAIFAQTGFGITEILIGTTTAAIVGYAALKLLWKTLANKKFHLFAFYCWLLGIILIALDLTVF
jgi:undecaprenyl-diphosphatase